MSFSTKRILPHCRNGKKDLSFRRSEKCSSSRIALTDGKIKHSIFQGRLPQQLASVEGINILACSTIRSKQVSEDTVLAKLSCTAEEVKMVPQMPEAVIYPFGLNRVRSWRWSEFRFPPKSASFAQGPPGTGKSRRLNIIANVVRAGRPWRSYPTTTLQHTMWRKSWKRRMPLF